MQLRESDTYDGYIKALTDISRAITSDLYIEDLLKLIVMVTARVTGIPHVSDVNDESARKILNA